MCSGPEAGSYLRLIDFVYHSILDLRVIKKKEKDYGLRFTSSGAVPVTCQCGDKDIRSPPLLDQIPLYSPLYGGV